MKRLLALTLLLLLVPVFALAGGLEDQITKTYIAPNIKGYPTASLPATANRGQLAYDTTTNELKVYTGSAWVAATGGGAPTDATFITQTADATLSGEQALGSLSSGCISVTTTTGVLASTGAACTPNGAKYLVQQADSTLSAEQSLGALSSGCLSVTTTTGVVASTGVDCAPTSAKYILQTADSTLSAEQSLGALASGCLSVTTTTGVLASSGSACGSGGGMSIGGAVTSGTAQKLLYVDVSGNLAQIIGADGTVPTWSGGALTTGTIDAAPSTATYLMQTANSGTSAEQALGSLASGCLSVTTTTGVVASSSAACGTVTGSSLTSNLPVIGNSGSAITVGTRSGNTTAYVTTTGTQTSGDCVKIDASGNHIANGSACGGSSYDPLDQTKFTLVDDFTGKTAANVYGELEWLATATGGTAATTKLGTSWPENGLVQIGSDGSGASAGGQYTYNDFAGNGYGLLANLSSNTNWTIKWRFMINQTANTRFRIGVGLANSSIEPSDGLWLRYDKNATYNDSAFVFQCRSGSSNTTVTPTGTMTATASTWYSFRVYSTVAGTANYELLSASGASLATGSCATVSTGGLAPQAILAQDGAGAAVTGKLDRFSLSITGLSR